MNAVTHSVTVTSQSPNVAPVVNAGPDKTITKGSQFVSSGSFTDSNTDTWTATVNYGDASGTASLSLNNDKTFPLSHTYVNTGMFTVRVNVTDNKGGVGTDTANVTVTEINGAPVLGEVVVPLDPVKINTVIQVSASLTDPNSQDTFTARWEWDDKSNTSLNFPAGTKAITGNHTYTKPGVYTINLTVKDKGGLTANKEALSYVVVYDPNGGYVIRAAGNQLSGRGVSTVRHSREQATLDLYRNT